MRPDLHHQGVAQRAPERRVQAGGKSEIPADARPAGGAAGARELRRDARVAGEAPRDADRASRSSVGDEVDPRRDDRCRQDQEDGGGGRRRRTERQHQAGDGQAAPAAHRGPHFGQAPEATGEPGHHEEAEAEIDGERRRHRHQPGRCAQREEQVAAGRDMEGVHHQDGDQQDRQRIDDGRDAARRRAHRTEEEDAGGKSTDGHHDLHPPRRPGPGDVREDRPGRHEHHGQQRGGPVDFPQGGAGGHRHQDGTQAGDAQPDGVLGHSRLVGPAHRRRRCSRTGARSRNRARPPAAATARASRRPAVRRSATAARTGPDCSVVPRTTGLPSWSRRTTEPSAPSATRSAASASAGSSTVMVTGSAAGCSSSCTIRWPAWAVAAPVDEAAGVARHVGAGAPGQALVRARSVEAGRPSHPQSAGAPAAPGRTGATRGVPPAGRAAPASSTIATRTVRPKRCRTSPSRTRHGGAAPE